MLNQQILKQQLGGIQGNLKFETIEPFCSFAERWFIDLAGKELLAYLAEIGTPTAGTDEADLLHLSQSCMSWKAYELAFPHLKLRASDLGLQKLNTQNTVAIAKWEYVDSREANLAMLDLALENFWLAIEHTRPAVWLESNAYVKRQRLFIRSAAELSTYIPALGRKNRLFEDLTTYIERAEKFYIKPILTRSVFADLKGRWSDSTVNLTTDERELIEAIKPALAHMALFEAYAYLPLNLDVTGITERRSKDGTMEEVAPSDNAKTGQKRQLYQDGQVFLSELKEYLEETASPTLWPGFYEIHTHLPGQPEADDFTNSSLVIL